MVGIVALVLLSTVVAGAVDLGAAGGPSATAENEASAAQAQPDGFADSTNLSDAESAFYGEGVNDTAGLSVANAGDVNGDGVTDLIVGAPRNSSAAPNAGAAYVVYGPADPGDVNLSDADVVLRAPENNELAGWSVSTAGDVNGDGLDDVVVGAPYNDSAAPNGGAAYVIYGNESLPSAMNLSEADAVLAGTADDGLAGYSVAAVNGTNGTDAVAVGAPYANTSGTNAGAAYVVDGDTIADSPDVRVNLSDADATFLGERDGSNAGWSVADAGDVNDDGVGDVAVGAPGYNATDGTEGLTRTGAVYVVNGSADDTVSLEDATATYVGVSEGDRAGWSVAGAGDVNNDTVDDLIVGAPYNDSNNRTNAGAAYVVYGDDDLGDEGADDGTSLAEADVRMAGEGALDRAGWSVASYGADGTGCDAASDVLVGAPANDTSAENAGAAYLVNGDDALDDEVNLSDADATFLGAADGDKAGFAVADAGDFFDDGDADLVVGAPQNDSLNRTDAGAAYALRVDCPETVAPETEAPTETDSPTATGTVTATETPTDTATDTATGTDTETDTATDTATVTDTETETVTETDTETETAAAPETETDTVTETDTATDTATATETPTQTTQAPGAEPEEGAIDFVALCFDSDQTDRRVIIVNNVEDNAEGDPVTVNYREGGPGMGPESVVHGTDTGLYEQSGSPGVIEAGEGTDVSGDRSASSPCAPGQTQLRFAQSELDRGSIKAYPDDADTGEGEETETPTETPEDDGDDEDTETPTETPDDDGDAGNAPAADQTALETLSTSPLFPAPFVGLMGLSLAVLATTRTRED